MQFSGLGRGVVSTRFQIPAGGFQSQSIKIVMPKFWKSFIKQIIWKFNVFKSIQYAQIGWPMGLRDHPDRV